MEESTATFSADTVRRHLWFTVFISVAMVGMSIGLTLLNPNTRDALIFCGGFVVIVLLAQHFVVPVGRVTRKQLEKAMPRSVWRFVYYTCAIIGFMLVLLTRLKVGALIFLVFGLAGLAQAYVSLKNMDATLEQVNANAR